jgi:DNA modification methylase
MKHPGESWPRRSRDSYDPPVAGNEREGDGALYYGDNLDVLRRYVEDESVDLVYLDPPFNSSKDYNVLFLEQDGTRSAAQVKAFKDTWEWDETAARVYHELVEGGGNLSKAMQAFRLVVGETDMLAYLSMMAPRLAELHRVMKPSGSIYLHCDPSRVTTSSS